MKKLFILLILLVNMNVASRASAQILIEEGKVVLAGKPGDSIVNSILVHNTSDQNINVRAYWEDFAYVSPYDGKKNFLPPGSTVNSISKFTSFTPAEFSLGPFAKKKISYSVNVPHNAQGGYYGVLFFEKVDDKNLKRTGVKVVTRVGCLLFLETENKRKNAKVGDLVAFTQSLRGDFMNTSDIILIPQGIYYVLGQEGLVVDRGELGKLYIPPDSIAKFEINISPDLAAGRYTMVITFDLGEGDTLVKEIDFAKGTDSVPKILEVRD